MRKLNHRLIQLHKVTVLVTVEPDFKPEETWILEPLESFMKTQTSRFDPAVPRLVHPFPSHCNQGDIFANIDQMYFK